MKTIFSIALALSIAATGAPAWAESNAQPDPHHPAETVPAPKAKAKAMPGKSNPAMSRMDDQMKTMQEMHDKMMAAKTPEERNALMAEQMKTMQDGMGMMNGMSSGGMGGSAGTQGDAATRMQMMEKRMGMMQSMMQMMMDRLPAAPAK